MKIQLIKATGIEEIEADDYTIKQLQAMGLKDAVEQRLDIDDWQKKWDALPDSTKNSPLGIFLKKLANKSGAKLQIEEHIKAFRKTTQTQ